MIFKTLSIVAPLLLALSAHAEISGLEQVIEGTPSGGLGEVYQSGLNVARLAQCLEGQELSRVTEVQTPAFTRKAVKIEDNHVTVTFYTFSKARKIVHLNGPYRPGFGMDLYPVCKEKVVLGYELAGEISIAVSFTVPGLNPAPAKLQALASALEELHELKDLKTWRAPFLISPRSASVSSTLTSDWTEPLNKPAAEAASNFAADGGVSKLSDMAYDLAQKLDEQYPASRVQNLTRSKRGDRGFVVSWVVGANPLK